MVSIDCARDRPAVSDPAISWRVSGRALLNLLRRRLRLKPRHIHGSSDPASEEEQPDEQAAATDDGADEPGHDHDADVQQQPLGGVQLAAGRLETRVDPHLDALVAAEQLRGRGLGRRQLVLLLGRGVVAGARAPGRVHLDGFLGGHLPRLRDRHGEDSEEADAEGDETGVEGPGWQVGQCQDDDKRAHRAPREKIIGSTVTLECVIFSRNLGRRPVGIRPPMARPCWSKPAEWS